MSESTDPSRRASTPASSQAASIPVWDPFVRLFHWTLALGFFVSVGRVHRA